MCEIVNGTLSTQAMHTYCTDLMQARGVYDVVPIRSANGR